MIHILRRHMQWLLIVVAAIVILAFVWFYNQADIGRIRASYVAQAYGKPVSEFELRSLRRFQELASDLGLYPLLASLGGFDERDESSNDYLWNLLVLRHEARQLQIQPTDAQVREAIRKLPAFQTDGSYDPARFTLVTSQVLPTRGFTVRQLDEVVRDLLRLEKLRALVGASVTVSTDEARTLHRRRSERLHASVVRLKRDDFLAGSDPSEEEIRAGFERGKDKLVMPARRRVRHVRFQLPESATKLQEGERLQALQQLADRADEFCQKMIEPGANFDELARRQGLEPRESSLFSEAEPDPELAKVSGALAAAALLRPEDPDSDPVQVEESFLVLHLSHYEAGRPMTLDEARGGIVTSLRTERAQAKMEARGNELRAQIAAALKEGRSFAEAARARGLEPVVIPPFSPSEPPADVADAGLLIDALTGLDPGHLSRFTADDAGGVLAHLARREPAPADKEEEQVGELARRLRFMRQSAAFQEWLRVRREEAAIRL